MHSRKVAVYAATLLAVAPRDVAAADPCWGALTSTQVVRCALDASTDVQQARLALRATEARRVAAGIVLPSNPVLSGTVEGGLTRAPGPVQSPTVEWQASLAQEVEIAGQRGKRLAVVDAEANAQRRRVAVAEQEVAATALRGYFEAMAAKANLALTDALAQSSDSLAVFAEGRARESLMAPIDAHLTRAEAVRVGVVRADAQRRLDVARATLAAVLGRTSIDVEPTGADFPLPTESPNLASLVERALAARGDVAAAQLERTVADRQIALLRRSRAPNITLSAFTGLNVIGEHFLGGALSMPLPLPAPIGHTLAGDIAEAQVRREQADVTIEQVRRRVRLEVAQAFAEERARARALELYTPTLLQQARTDLAALRDGLATRQLSVREALISQRTLIELLLGNLEARVGYAVTAVELNRAIGAIWTEAAR